MGTGVVDAGPLCTLQAKLAGLATVTVECHCGDLQAALGLGEASPERDSASLMTILSQRLSSKVVVLFDLLLRFLLVTSDCRIRGLEMNGFTYLASSRAP